MFEKLNLVLVETRFPENIGSIARASANFGNCPIRLVQPERWDRVKALPLATKQGSQILDGITLYENLASAVSKSMFCVGTSARTGGFRREVLTPQECAKEIIAHLEEGEEVSLIFGPEDRGLENEHLELCQRLVCIPTDKTSSSLNIAHAAVVLLYECFTTVPKSCEKCLQGKQDRTKKGKGAFSRRITNEERVLLHEKIKKSLVDLEVIQAQNPEYFFQPMARFLDRSDIRRHEMDLILGICRQLQNHKEKLL